MRGDTFTVSIAIGVDNNNVVGSHRAGPRNQRHSPTVINSAFYPSLMWNGRFSSLSGDPFNNSQGFKFPPPEGTTRFTANDPIIKHLLIAQAHIPPTELVEVAGFTGTTGTLGNSRLDRFDNGMGSAVPLPDSSGFRNEPIRNAVLQRINSNSTYRQLFGEVFPSVAAGGLIDFTMFGQAIAEFEFTLVFANAPIDKFARGNHLAMSTSQKRGALIFFGKGNCVQCHAVGGQSNEMFSDFKMHTIGVPQIAPYFGVGKSNMIYDGAGENEDFGLEQITGNSLDRYKFRTSPLRNVALQSSFFHNGSFTQLEYAIQHHLNVNRSARYYRPVGLANDLKLRLGPIAPVLKKLDPLLTTAINLNLREFNDLVSFVKYGLLDERAKKENLCKLVPSFVPSGFSTMQFEECPQNL